MINSKTISWREECSQQRRSYNTKSRLYPYLFDERLYIVNSTNHWQDASISHSNQHSFLKIKRIIKELRSKDGSLKPDIGKNMYKNLSFTEKKEKIKPLIVHSITRILDVIATTTNIDKNNQKNIFYNQWKQYSSLHGALSHIEYRWQSYGSISQGIIPSMVHPEIIIRIIRKVVEDVTFIHFCRELLYQCSSKNRMKGYIFEPYYINSFEILLFNWYILEYEKFFFTEMPRYLFYQPALRQETENDFSILQKIMILQSSIINAQNQLEDTILTNNINIIKQNNQVSNHIFDRTHENIYQYIRTKNISFLNLETTHKNLGILQKRYENFLQYRLGFTNERNYWTYKSTDSSDIFLGYILHFKPKQIFIRIETNSYKVKTYVLNKSIVILNPLTWIIRILAIYRFCTYFAYPISKSGWSPYPDLIIIDRFRRIKDSLCKYYSGSLNQKDLAKINHILHYSCAKTLACKHKTNLKKIWKKYGKNLSIKHPVSKRKSLQMSRTKMNENARINIRFWNFYYQKPDPMTMILEKRYRFVIK